MNVFIRIGRECFFQALETFVCFACFVVKNLPTLGNYLRLPCEAFGEAG